MTDETTTTEPSADRALDRTHAPGVPSAVADLWDGWGYPGGTEPEAVTVALGGITSIVNAMAGGDLYRVTLGGSSTAWTDLKGHRVAITSAALADPRLTTAEALGITTAMAVHEAGHARLTAPMQRAVERAFGKPGTSPLADRAARLSNVVEDERLEARTASRWPAYGPLFPLAMWWVAQRYPSGAITRLPEDQAEAVNFALAAIRYGQHTQWGPAVLAERDWWADWGQRAASTDKPKAHVEAIREALDRIAPLPEHKPQPQPQPQPQPGQSGEGEGEGEGEGAGSDWSDADDAEDEGEGSDWSDEASADDAEDEATGGEWDDDAEDEGEGSGDATDDEPEAGPDGDEDGDADGEGGSVTAPAPSAPDEDAEDTAEADEADGDEAEGDSDGDEPEPGDEDGEYIHRDQPSNADLPESTEESDSTFYGPAGDQDQPMPEGAGVEQEPERDALTDPLPAHAADAVADDDRNRDITLGQVIEAQATVLSRESVEVRHGDGTSITVNVIPLATERERIATNPAVQQAIRAAFTSRRMARDARDVARSGRVSGHRAYRVAAGFDNVFTRRDQISPDRLDVHLLVDASGSMASREYRYNPGSYRSTGRRRLDMASQMAANVTEALARLPYVRVHVWAHNNGGSRPILHDVYDSRKGEPLARIGGIRAYGDNRDGSAIRALASLITRERSSRERSVMVVISDGAPCEPEEWVRGAAEAARTQGIGVMSVAIAGGLTRTQEACYGRDYVVPWTGDWDDLTRGMGKIIGRMA